MALRARKVSGAFEKRAPGRTRCAWRGSLDRIFPFYFVSADQEEESFTLREIKEKLEDEEPDWRYIFKGVKKIEVEQIEKNLKCRAAKEEIRYDFIFYTPTCRYVRVKVSL